MQKKRGISLIVLSITILVMAILAATAIIALEDSGIIKRAKSTTTQQNYADEYTRLQVIKNGILTDNLGTITVEEYIAELRSKNMLEAGQTTNTDGSITVTTKSGFEVVLKANGVSDLSVMIDGYTQANNNNSGSAGNNSGDNNQTPSTPTVPDPIVITSANYPNLGKMEDYTGYSWLEYWGKDLYCNAAAQYKVVVSSDTMIYYDAANDIGDSFYVDNFTQIEGQGIFLSGMEDPTTYQGIEVILDNKTNGVLGIGWCSYRGGMFKISIYPLDENGNYLTDYDYDIETTEW